MGKMLPRDFKETLRDIQAARTPAARRAFLFRFGPDRMQWILDAPDIFLDQRDWRLYEVVQQGPIDWMYRNLAYEAPGSKANASRYARMLDFGQLYRWDGVQAALPPGWRLPTRTEMQSLVRAGTSDAARYRFLRSAMRFPLGGAHLAWENDYRGGREQGHYWTAGHDRGKEAGCCLLDGANQGFELTTSVKLNYFSVRLVRATQRD